MSNRCVCCNTEIPEGYQVCPNCIANVHEIKSEDSTLYINKAYSSGLKYNASNTCVISEKDAKRRMVISLDGCDDSTIFDMYLSNDEINLVNKMSELSHKYSEYPCMPVISICTYEDYR